MTSGLSDEPFKSAYAGMGIVLPVSGMKLLHPAATETVTLGSPGGTV